MSHRLYDIGFSPVRDDFEDVEAWAEAMSRWANQLRRELVETDDERNTGGGERFNATNYTDTRDFDASTAVLADTNNFLGTIVKVLRQRGLLP